MQSNANDEIVPPGMVFLKAALKPAAPGNRPPSLLYLTSEGSMLGVTSSTFRPRLARFLNQAENQRENGWSIELQLESHTAGQNI